MSALNDREEDSANVSIVDLFAGAMGASLLLMVVFAMRVTVVPAARVEDGVDLPLMLTLGWTADSPEAGGFGPGLVDLRLVEQGTQRVVDVVQPDEDRGWRVVHGYGRSWIERRFGGSSDGSARSVVWIAEEVADGDWTLQARVTVEPQVVARQQTVSDLERYVFEVDSLWGQHVAGTKSWDVLRDSVLARSESFGSFLTATREFAGKWAEEEARFSAEEDADPRIPDPVRRSRRWERRLDLLDEYLLAPAREGAWSYPRPDHWTGGPAAPEDAVEFEGWLRREVTQLSAPSDGWVAPWLEEQVSLFDEGRGLDLSLSFTGPVTGDSAMVNQLCHLLGLSSAARDAAGWVTLGEVELRDGVAQLSLDPGMLRVVDGSTHSAGSTATLTPLVAPLDSEWDRAIRRFRRMGSESYAGAGGGESARDVFQRVDQALEYLIGRFDRSSGSFVSDHHSGDAHTALSLAALVARGHQVGSKRSRFGSETRLAASKMCEAVLKNEWGATGQHYHIHYHRGFTLFALVQLYASVHGSDPEGALAMTCQRALLRAIEVVTNDAATGGQGGLTDSSVASITVKSLIAARELVEWMPSLSSRDQHVNRIDSALARCSTFLESCHIASTGGFGYSPGDSSESPTRLAGAMLGLALAREGKDLPRLHSGVPDISAVARVVEDWRPDPNAPSGHDHYGLFYAVEVALRDTNQNRAEAWIRWSRKWVARMGQESDGSFGGDTIDTAMTVWLVLRPLLDALVQGDEWRFN